MLLSAETRLGLQMTCKFSYNCHRLMDVNSVGICTDLKQLADTYTLGINCPTVSLIRAM